MRLDAVNLKQSRVWIKRSKNSLDTEQPLAGDELLDASQHSFSTVEHGARRQAP
jgi:hypothetical protein